jgi:two-component system LytT family response regulator
MIKTIIIEDEANAGEMLQKMLQESDSSIEVMDICKDIPSAIKSIKRNQPDLIFLDIELPVYSGLQIFEFLNEDETNFKIIFVTAFNQYAINAFEMSAVDYILKPVEFDKLQTAILKFKSAANQHNNTHIQLLKNNLKDNAIKKIVVPVQNGYEIISIQNIIYIKAEGSYSRIDINNNESLLVSKNLKYFEELLGQSDHFYRIHRSYLLNLQYAKKITRNSGGMVILENGIEIPIVSDKVDDLISIINGH